MLSKNPYGSFDERPEHKAEQFLLRLLFLVPKIMERLLHRLPKLLLELLWIEGKEFLVERTNCGPFI